MTQLGTVRVASTPAVQVPLDAPSERLSPDNTPKVLLSNNLSAGPEEELPLFRRPLSSREVALRASLSQDMQYS